MKKDSLCQELRPDSFVLKASHINISKEMNDFQVELYPPINYDRILPYIDNFCGILLSATESIHHILETNCIKEIEELKAEFLKQRNTIMTEPHALDSQG